MKLHDLFDNQAGGMDGRSKDEDVVFIVPVDAYIRENLIYLFQCSKGKLDFRNRSKLSSDDLWTITMYWKTIRNFSCAHRLYSYLLDIDTWEVKRGSDV